MKDTCVLLVNPLSGGYSAGRIGEALSALRRYGFARKPWRSAHPTMRHGARARYAAARPRPWLSSQAGTAPSTASSTVLSPAGQPLRSSRSAPQTSSRASWGSLRLPMRWRRSPPGCPAPLQSDILKRGNRPILSSHGRNRCGRRNRKGCSHSRETTAAQRGLPPLRASSPLIVGKRKAGGRLQRRNDRLPQRHRVQCREIRRQFPHCTRCFPVRSGIPHGMHAPRDQAGHPEGCLVARVRKGAGGAGIRTFAARDVEVRGVKPLQADGDYYLDAPVRIRTVPDFLRIVV